MSFEENFCSSPWFHMRVRNNGGMSYCRWAWGSEAAGWIQQQTPEQYFGSGMEPIRQQMLEGEAPKNCQTCKQMERHGKVSGRQKQLLKTGIRLEQFKKTLLSSPWLPVFTNNLTQTPQDWQIDLGNFCNSACLMCDPTSSSKLAQEHLRLGLISMAPPTNWTDNEALVDRLISSLLNCDQLRYIHFIGGETLITPAFEQILQALLNAGKQHQVTIGFTTNLTVWSQKIVDLLTQFESINLGVSVETFTPVNDYIRWPSRIDSVKVTFERWVQHAQQHNWLVQIRTTPTILSVYDLITVYDWAWKYNVGIESCNFLQDPAFLRPSLLPQEHRTVIIDTMKQWVTDHSVDSDIVINTRNPNFVKAQIAQDLTSYIQYLSAEPDDSYQLPNLMRYLVLIESNRGNRVLDYLPQYEKLFRTAGYTN